ncbi:diguanylate cyclase/phosphodiesterase with extracellular sensor [Deinococcus maricopensis DSM 21211]|uniref:Diguanylate cyclase/phosphodiesterase with extracellular sensor n=1 Tax=Deinococcus maricopensis (strain DSM 21211 / LMG 22137 / NRRL B-23946 / LB-34) TaxID=709986 RepID=E8U6I7_DEIML|nr:diguanylate cyclase/phosphodiesterase with extracellular sensor [Deinococcus maricopensis DSM 21211]
MVLITAALLLAFLVLLGALLSAVIARWFDTYERDRARLNTERVLLAVRAEQNALDALSFDWGSWDDAYAYVRAPARHREFETENFSASALAGLHVNFIAYLGADGRLLVGRWIHGGLTTPALPDAVRRALPTLQRRGGATLIVTPAGALLLAQQPVYTSEGGGRAAGRVLIGRLIDPRALQHTTRLNVSLVLNAPAGAHPPVIRQPDGSLLSRATLTDVYGQPSVEVHVRLSGDVHEQGVMAARWTLAGLSVLALIFGGLGLAYLERTLFAPLSRYRRFVDDLDFQDTRARLNVGGHDELSALGAALNALLDRLAGERRADAARQLALEVIANGAPPQRIADAVAAAARARWPDAQVTLTGETPPPGQRPHPPAVIPDDERTLSVPVPGGRGALTIRWPTTPTRPEQARDAAADLAGLYGLALERVTLQTQLTHQATHDPLTGLPNRRHLLTLIEGALARADREGTGVAVLLLDLDRFKRLNDTLGHAAGDAFLRVIAERLRGVVRSSDHIARLGGDEFVIVLEGLSAPDQASVFTSRLLDVLRAPITLGEQQFVTTASVGISLFPQDARTPEELLRTADLAMYTAKHDGKNGHAAYAPSAHDAALHRLRLESALRAALQGDPDAGTLHLAYQPQVDFRTGRATAAEALLRWTHPTLGAVSPAAIIPVAEDSGLILPLGQWVLTHATQQAAAWHASGLPVRVAVNVSARQFAQADFPEVVQTALHGAGLPASALELEVTESLLMRDMAATSAHLRDLAALGVRVAVDDFGTGYSSLSYLHQLPIHALKVDQSFVRDLARTPQARGIVDTVITLARRLGLESVAEGVETPEQAALLRDLGATFAQGYLFARPTPHPETAFRTAFELHTAEPTAGP